MANPLTNPGGHVIFTQGEKLTEADLERMGEINEQTLFHFLARVFQGPDNLPISGFPANDCKVTASGLTATIGAGWGLYYDSSETDAFGTHYKPIVVSSSFTQAINAHDASNPRWDLISIGPDTDDDESATRNVKNITTGAISSQTVDKRRRWKYALTYTAGTPAATPTTPSTPSGHLALARIRVPASTGAVTVDDLRPRLAVAADLASEPPTEYASDFVPGSSTELVVTENPAGASMKLVVASGSAVIAGQRYRYGRTEVTLATADATNPRYDYIVADTDGTVKAVTGTPAGSPTPPSIGADQIKLALVYVAASDTTITNSNITDERIRQPYDGATHLRADSVPSAKLDVGTKPLKASLTVGAETLNAIGCVVATKDGDGTAYAGATRYIARLWSSKMAPLTEASWTVAETGVGSELTTSSGNTGLIFATDANGAATITVTDTTGVFAGDVILEVRPIDVPGITIYERLTFA